MEALGLIATLLGLLVIAVPLCMVAIGVHRIFVASRESARSLVKNTKLKVVKPLTHADAARERALTRQQERRAGVSA